MRNFTGLYATNTNCIRNGKNYCANLVPKALVWESNAVIIGAVVLAYLAYKNRDRLRDCMSAVVPVGFFAGQDTTQAASLLEEGHQDMRPGN